MTWTQPVQVPDEHAAGWAAVTARFGDRWELRLDGCGFYVAKVRLSSGEQGTPIPVRGTTPEELAGQLQSLEQLTERRDRAVSR